jgi:hypothetical protein
MATKEPSEDRAFAHVVWAAHILCEFLASHDKLIQEKQSLDSTVSAYLTPKTTMTTTEMKMRAALELTSEAMSMMS